MFSKKFEKKILHILCSGLFVLLLPVMAVAAPRIFFTDITGGPNIGGENNNGAYLSIFGKGFGATQGTSSVKINGIEVADYKYWGVSQYARSDIQQITVQPGSLVTSGPIKIVVNGESSNTDHTFTIRPGDIYFVANDNPENGPPGNDATGVIGDINKPFRLVYHTYMRSDFGPGDFLVMRGGVWNEVGKRGKFVRLDKSGGIDNPLVFSGYPGENMVIRVGDAAKSAFTSYIPSVPEGEVNWVVLANFEIEKPVGSSGRSIDWEVWNYFRLVNVEVTGGACGGGMSNSVMGVNVSSHSVVYGLSIHDTDPDCLGNKSHLFYFANGPVDDFEIGWSAFYNDVGGSFALQLNDDDERNGQVTLTNITVHDTMIYNVARGVVLANGVGSGIKFYNNLIYNTGGYYNPTNRSDISPHSRSAGIRIGNHNAEIEIYNNVFYGQHPVGRGGVYLHAVKSVTMKNNIIQTTDPNEYYYRFDPDFNHATATIVAENNIWFGSSQGVPSWDSNPINKDPLLVDPTVPARNFRLKPGSPAINAGVTVSVAKDMEGHLRPDDGKFDIGAYEYCKTDCATMDTLAPAIPSSFAINKIIP